MTKEVIEVQKRMEDLIEGAEAVGTKLGRTATGGAAVKIPSFSEFMAAQRAGGGGVVGDQIAAPRISYQD